MVRWNGMAASVAIGITALIGLGACGSDKVAGGGGDNGSLSDPATFEAEMRESFLAATLGILDGFDRLIAALNAGTQGDGVTVLPNGSGGVDVTVTVDLDGIVGREAVISGSSAGTAFTLTSIDDPQLPSLVASAGMRVTETSPTTVLVDQMTGSLAADPPGSGNAASATIGDAAVSVDLATGTPDGFIDVAISGEGETLDVVVTFESNGAGGWQVRFTGTGFDFTIP